MKKFLILLFTIFISFCIPVVADAATANIKVTTNRSSLIIGNTFTVTVTVSSSTPMANWEFNLKYDTSKLSFVKSDHDFHVVGLDMTEKQKTASYTYTFKAKASGTASISISSASVMGWNGEMNLNKSGASVSIMSQEQAEANYSKNDYLSKLEVEGATLSPKFDKNTMEYTVELEPNTKKIVVNATKEDSKSSISGTGEIEVSKGVNKIEIVVTAQKGNTRTYVINAIVKELDPIEVTIDNNTFNVIQEEEFLLKPNDYFKQTTTLINGKEVPAFYNELSNITLICLKDPEGNINFYIVNENEYTLYNEIKFNSLTIQLLDMDNSLIPKGYNETTITIGDKTVTAYKKDGYEYPLIYGLNLENGIKNLYKYDSKENTLQRYEDVTIDDNLYFNSLVGMFGFIIVSYIIFIVLLVNKNKKQKNFLDKTMRMNIIDVNNNALENVLDVKTKKELKKEKKLAKKEAKKNKNQVVEETDNKEKMASL